MRKADCQDRLQIGGGRPVKVLYWSTPTVRQPHPRQAVVEDALEIVSQFQTCRKLANVRIPDRSFLSPVRQLRDCSSAPGLRVLGNSLNTVFFLELHLAMTTFVRPVSTNPLLTQASPSTPFTFCPSVAPSCTARCWPSRGCQYSSTPAVEMVSTIS
jgi:hypothetical protein